MRIAGTVIVIAGIFLIALGGLNFTTKSVVYPKTGTPAEMAKPHYDWRTYTGITFSLVGFAFMVGEEIKDRQQERAEA